MYFGVFLLYFGVCLFIHFFVLGGGGGGRGGECFNGPRNDKSYAYLLNLAGDQMRQNYDGLLVKVVNVRR